MAAKRFSSRIDTLLLAILIVCLVADVAAIGLVLVAVKDPLEMTVAVLGCLLLGALLASILVATYYVVDKETLKIVSGPFRVSVDISDISSVTETRSLLSSPALSRERLLIEFGNKRKIMVSPKDQRRFLKAIKQQLRE